MRGRGGGPLSRRYTVSRRNRGGVELAMTRISRTYPSATCSRGRESRQSNRPRNDRSLKVGIGSEGNVVLGSVLPRGGRRGGACFGLGIRRRSTIEEDDLARRHLGRSTPLAISAHPAAVGQASGDEDEA